MPSTCQSIGFKDSGFYVVALAPSKDDVKTGVILSGTQGYELGKWGIPALAYRTYIFDDIEQPDDIIDTKFQEFVAELNSSKPAIILTLGNKVLNLLCPQYATKKKYSIKKTEALKSSLLNNYSGSICVSPLLQFEHYIIPTLAVPDVWKDWSRRDETISIDVARAVDEYKFYKLHKYLNPIPATQYKLTLAPSFLELKEYLEKLCTYNVPISVDIETIRPKKNSDIFPKHPGFPYTIALAPNTTEAVSFCFWSYTAEELVVVFRLLQTIFTSKKIIGQNFISFDLNMLEALLGFSFDLNAIIDTKLRHHILHPELPHKLQFLCKQYTRQVYYKDEGKGWSPRSKKKMLDLLRYGAYDVLVTYAVYEGQELEFKDRPWLK
jgi:hypothetical protein